MIIDVGVVCDLALFHLEWNVCDRFVTAVNTIGVVLIAVHTATK